MALQCTIPAHCSAEADLQALEAGAHHLVDMGTEADLQVSGAGASHTGKDIPGLVAVDNHGSALSAVEAGAGAGARAGGAAAAPARMAGAWHREVTLSITGEALLTTGAGVTTGPSHHKPMGLPTVSTAKGQGELYLLTEDIQSQHSTFVQAWMMTGVSVDDQCQEAM